MFKPAWDHRSYPMSPWLTEGPSMTSPRFQVSLSAHRPVVAPPLTWDETACLLCGRDEADVLTEAPDPLPGPGQGRWFAVVRCRHCGLCYTNPRPSAASLTTFYPPGYAPHRLPQDKDRVRPGLLPVRWRHRLFGRPCPERRGQITGCRPGRLLDVGCGGGSYLRRMARLGWTVTGLDLVPEVAWAVRERLGCVVHVGTLPHPEVRPASFDLVTLWQVLEHVHRPLDLLREVLRVLVPGGRVIVAVPNFECPAAGWFGPHWYGLDLPRHLTHFTPATLRAMLEAAGFEVESVRGLAHPEWLRKSAARSRQAGVNRPLTALLRWRWSARVASWVSFLGGRAEAVVAVARRPGD